VCVCGERGGSDVCERVCECVMCERKRERVCVL
jgi:hypothetical protein